jgi:hypothetical protein
MKNTFYIVFMAEKPILMSTLSYDGTFYSYKPFNLDKCKIPRITKEFKTKIPPHLLSRRTYSEGRQDLKKLLSDMGLGKYDLWEMVKKTEGKLVTDSIRFLTKDSLKEKGLNHIIEETQQTELKYV